MRPANGQPAFGLYQYSSVDARWNARAIYVLTLLDGAIARLTAFELPTGPQLFPVFGLPLVLPGAGAANSGRQW
jgi:RNA polymerase sigma-70 factor (ECF subfamily)